MEAKSTLYYIFVPATVSATDLSRALCFLGLVEMYFFFRFSHCIIFVLFDKHCLIMK